MPKTISSPLLMAALLALGLSAAPAQAQLARTFVSSFGNDANDCNRGTPCRTFQAARERSLSWARVTWVTPIGTSWDKKRFPSRPL